MASYIEKSLGEGERLIARAHLHWIYLFGALVAAITVVGLVIAIPIWIRYYTTEIGVTTHRFIFKTGWVRVDTQEIALNNIEGVQVHQSVWGRIFNFGKIVIEGTGVDAVQLPSMIGNPIEFRRGIETAKSAKP